MILVALDYDDHLAKPLAHRATALARANASKLKFVTVAPPMATTSLAASGIHGAPSAIPAMDKKAHETLMEQRENFLRELSDAKELNIKVSHEVRVGAAEEEIIRCAEDCGADLVVLGAHQRGFLDRLFRPSISGEVARKAHCAVLILPEQFALDQFVAE